jgi:hypothetical protein
MKAVRKSSTARTHSSTDLKMAFGYLDGNVIQIFLDIAGHFSLRQVIGSFIRVWQERREQSLIVFLHQGRRVALLRAGRAAAHVPVD